MDEVDQVQKFLLSKLLSVSLSNKQILLLIKTLNNK